VCVQNEGRGGGVQNEIRDGMYRRKEGRREEEEERGGSRMR
jgi:hypothetical protein